MQYDAILVDLDGVIRVWPESDESIAAAYNMPIDAIRNIAFSPELLNLAITGEITDEEWRARVGEQLRGEFPGTDAQDALAQWSSQTGEVDQEVLSLLRNCDRSIKLVLVTNATSRLARDLDALDISNYFHAVVNSSTVGFVKPSEQIFRFALRQADTVPERALFIDDSKANVDAAASMGILGHVHANFAQLSSFLRYAGVLNAPAP
jgi:putative hydrolase of the HAD superfamily